MCKIVVLGALQQQAEALGTQFHQVFVLFNDMRPARNRKEMRSSGRVTYEEYSAQYINQEILVLRKLLKDISPDIIYANGFGQLWMVGLLIRIPGLFPRKPVVLVTSHNSWAWQQASKRLMMALSCHFFADGIFTLATFQENWLRRLGISPLKIRTIPNAVDTERFSPAGSKECFSDIFSEDKNSPIIVNAANINRLKGQDVLIKCINKVKKEKNNVRLVLMGDQGHDLPYEQLLKSLIAEYNLERNVFIMRKVDHDQIPGILRASDISVISSWSEVCPFILLESLSVGKVTISTTVGGIPDIITNDFNGFLVAPRDVEGFANCILKVANNPSLKMSIENQARISAIEKYSFDVIGREHKEFLSSIMGKMKYSNSH